MLTVRKEVLFTPNKLTPSTATRPPSSEPRQPLITVRLQFGVDSLAKTSRGVGDYRKT